MSTTIRQVFKDDDRDRVRSFFRTHLRNSTAFELPDRRTDAEIRIPSRIRVAEDGSGEIVAAAFASNNPDDVLRWRAQGNAHAADVIADEMHMIHEVAVAPSARRLGLGRQLVRAAIDDARGSGASLVCLVYDDRTPGLTEFYSGLGFEILGGGEQLFLEFSAIPATTIGFPQNFSSFHWALIILSVDRVRRHTL